MLFRSKKIQVRQATAADWLSVNPTLASGEFGLETDTNQTKIGDGVSTWDLLPYQGGSGTSSDSSATVFMLMGC